MDDIVGVATRVKKPALNVIVTTILNGKSDVKIYDKVIVTYDFAIKIT